MKIINSYADVSKSIKKLKIANFFFLGFMIFQIIMAP